MPATATAPAKAITRAITAPVVAGTVPALVPAIIAPAPEELHGFEKGLIIGAIDAVIKAKLRRGFSKLC
jgi:hypothetical protein